MQTYETGEKVLHGPFARYEDAWQLVNGGRAIGVQLGMDGQFWAYGTPGQLVSRTGKLERQLQMRLKDG